MVVGHNWHVLSSKYLIHRLVKCTIDEPTLFYLEALMKNEDNQLKMSNSLGAEYVYIYLFSYVSFSLHVVS